MQIKAVSKFIRISPTKSRLVIDLIRNKKASDAQEVLKYLNKKAARIVYKTLASAIASAKNKDMDLEKAIVKIAKIDQGPTYKRRRIKARGSTHPIKKRTSHITIVLSDDKPNE